MTLDIDNRGRPPFEPDVVVLDDTVQALIPAELWRESGRGTPEYTGEGLPEVEQIEILVGYDVELGPALFFERPGDPERRVLVALDDLFSAVVACQYWRNRKGEIS